MKNNRITFPQFSFVCFLASLTVLLFIDYNPSAAFFSLIFFTLVFDTVFIFVYRGNLKILKASAFVYLSVLSVIICTEFCKYMCCDLGYSIFWILALLILGFSFFSTVKGLEALSRASVIITFFIVFSVVYIAVSSFGNIKFDIKLFELKSLIVPLILLFPSAIYILNNNNIIKEKKYSFIFYAFSIMALLVYFHLLPKDKVVIGIFKGSDGLLLAVLTVSVIYFISNTAVAAFKNYKHRYLTNILYLSCIALASILTGYLTP